MIRESRVQIQSGPEFFTSFLRLALCLESRLRTRLIEKTLLEGPEGALSEPGRGTPRNRKIC